MALNKIPIDYETLRVRAIKREKTFQFKSGDEVMTYLLKEFLPRTHSINPFYTHHFLISYVKKLYQKVLTDTYFKKEFKWLSERYSPFVIMILVIKFFSDRTPYLVDELIKPADKIRTTNRSKLDLEIICMMEIHILRILDYGLRLNDEDLKQVQKEADLLIIEDTDCISSEIEQLKI